MTAEPTDGGPGAAEPATRPVSELSYAQASQELDEIVGELDEGLVDVDRLETRFQRAIEIVEDLDRRIRGARARVDALMPRLDALGEDLAPGEDADLPGR